MKIGILGKGHIGKTLVKKLGAEGHDVKVANSRGPETIDADLRADGAQAVTTQDAMRDVEIIIISIPLNSISGIAPLFAVVPPEAVVIDTSNYFPHRDGKIEAIDAGRVESLWVVEQLGRPIAKAWNAIGSGSFATKGRAKGTEGRIAIPIAADRERDREVAMALVEDTGFDAFDASALSGSWRQQPGAPAYCTELVSDELAEALVAADKARLPKRRDLGIAIVQERLGDQTTNPDAEWGLTLVGAINM